MVSIRARELLFKTNFQIWQSGGEEETFQGASPLPPPRRLQLVKGYEDELGGEKKISVKTAPKSGLGCHLEKSRTQIPRGFCNLRSAKRGRRGGAAPAGGRPRAGRGGGRSTRKADSDGHSNPSPGGSHSRVLSACPWVFF